jgi:hypothetical protein
MKTVYKSQFKVENDIEIAMPADAEILHVASQGADRPCIWAKVDTDLPAHHFYFCIRGTGQELTGEEGRHIGTFLIYNGSGVFQLFERAQK